MKIKSLKMATAAIVVAASVSLPMPLKARSSDNIPAAIELKNSSMDFSQSQWGGHSSHSSHSSHRSHSSHYSSRW